MRKYDYVICDIDRTLINANYEISQTTINTIIDLHKHGYKFGLASGRPVRVLKEMFIDKWNLGFKPELIIGMNGGQIYDEENHKLYEFDLISKRDAKTIIKGMIENGKTNAFRNGGSPRKWEIHCRKKDSGKIRRYRT